jgi:hypothetical protein
MPTKRKRTKRVITYDNESDNAASSPENSDLFEFKEDEVPARKLHAHNKQQSPKGTESVPFGNVLEQVYFPTNETEKITFNVDMKWKGERISMERTFTFTQYMLDSNYFDKLTQQSPWLLCIGPSEKNLPTPLDKEVLKLVNQESNSVTQDIIQTSLYSQTSFLTDLTQRKKKMEFLMSLMEDEREKVSAQIDVIKQKVEQAECDKLGYARSNTQLLHNLQIFEQLYRCKLDNYTSLLNSMKETYKNDLIDEELVRQWLEKYQTELMQAKQKYYGL